MNLDIVDFILKQLEFLVALFCRMSDSDDPEFTVDEHNSKKITWSDEIEGHVKRTGVNKTSVKRDSDDSSGSSSDSETSSNGYSSDEEDTASDLTRSRKIMFTHSKTRQVVQ